METKEEELSRCRQELAYWTKEKIQFCIDYYTERVKELERTEENEDGKELL